jgi:hypothetical protein
MCFADYFVMFEVYCGKGCGKTAAWLFYLTTNIQMAFSISALHIFEALYREM